jgi:hypothetical protein
MLLAPRVCAAWQSISPSKNNPQQKTCLFKTSDGCKSETRMISAGLAMTLSYGHRSHQINARRRAPITPTRCVNGTLLGIARQQEDMEGRRQIHDKHFHPTSGKKFAAVCFIEHVVMQASIVEVV